MIILLLFFYCALDGWLRRYSTDIRGSGLEQVDTISRIKNVIPTLSVAEQQFKVYTAKFCATSERGREVKRYLWSRKLTRWRDERDGYPCGHASKELTSWRTKSSYTTFFIPCWITPDNLRVSVKLRKRFVASKRWRTRGQIRDVLPCQCSLPLVASLR